MAEVDDKSGLASENAYIKDLQKGVRNVNKKISLMAKVDAIIADNPGVSLDDLVATRKINTDQKAQALKKPVLVAQLAQLEQQLAEYKRMEDSFQQRMDGARAELQQQHETELEELRTSLQKQQGEAAELSSSTRTQQLRQDMLVVSKFLKTAAQRRMQELDDGDTKAFEGLLSAVFGGDTFAVDAMENLILGAEQTVTSTEGESLDITFKRVKDLSLADDPSTSDPSPAANGTSTQDQPSTTDPTIAHAGLTEMDSATELAATTNGDHPAVLQTGTDDSAANAAADWDTMMSPTGADPASESWTMIPRDASETEPQQNSAITAGNAAAEAVVAASSDIPAPAQTASVPNGDATATPAAPSSNDGFHEVHHHHHHHHQGHHRGRGGPRGGFERGRGGGGRGRGRGGRGGRGRGGRGES